MVLLQALVLNLQRKFKLPCPYETAYFTIHPSYSLIKYIEPMPLDADGQPINDPSRATAKELSELAETLSDTQVNTFVRLHPCMGQCLYLYLGRYCCLQMLC